MPRSDTPSTRRIPQVPEIGPAGRTPSGGRAGDPGATVAHPRSATGAGQGVRPAMPAHAGAGNRRGGSASHRGATSGAPRGVSRATSNARGTRAQGRTSEQAPHSKGRAGKRVLIAVIVLIIALYVGGIAAFTFLFYPNTSIAGVDVSLLTAAAAEEKLDGAVDGYTLTVDDADLGFSWTFEPEGGRDIFNTGATVRARLAQNEPWAWPVRLFNSLTDPSGANATADDELSADPDLSLLGASFNRTDFETSLGGAVDAFNAGRSGTFDAASAWDAEAGAFTPEQVNAARQLNRDNVLAVALNALADLEENADLSKLSPDQLYLPLAGDLTDEQIQSICDTANGFLGTNVTFKLGDSDAGTLDASVIGPWITFDATTQPTLNADAVAAWASQLAQNMNTVGTERTYTRPDGKTITIGGGTYGWTVDEAALVQAVQDAVANHQTGDIAVPTSTQGVTYAGPGQPDWGAYADVDITEQRARFYDASGNLVWETGVVTGKDNGQDDTPTGVYKVNNKLRNITLVSQNKDPVTGEPDYESPVDYWIAFKGSSWGFHDASWQPDWVYDDPSAYHTRGSHGCVNTPYDKVAQLYDLIQVGDAVIVHY